jgi:hypothetical protein
MMLDVGFRPFSLCVVAGGLLGGASSVAMQPDSGFGISCRQKDSKRNAPPGGLEPPTS